MRWENPLRQALERTDAALGARTSTLSPEAVEVYGPIGLDFAWVDLEHTGPSAADSGFLERLSRAGEVTVISPLVRLPSGDSTLVRKALDAGIRSLLIPRVETATEVSRAVAASRFRHGDGPGSRGSASGRSAVWGDKPGDYVEREDGSACVGVMTENEAAVDAIEDILAVPDLGFVFVGTGNLSVSLGYPLETDHPAVREAIDTVREAALAAEVPVGQIASDADAARTAINDGYQLLRLGDEPAAARTVLGDRVAEITGGK